MEFICMSCGRKHTREGSLVDEHIRCDCGYSFYAFYNQWMKVVLPSDDITSVAATRAFQRFVVSTGRCQDVRVEPVVDYTAFLQKADPMGLMEVGLERYQTEVLGKSLLNCGDVASICESLKKHQDVIVKNKGSHIDIVEVRQKVKEKPAVVRELFPYLNGEYELKDWQKDIMKQNAERSGYLFGDAM